MVNIKFGVLSFLVCAFLLLNNAQGGSIPITLVQNAVAQGAVCLDGSPPAYHFDKGSGSGANNWIVHIEGGAWCRDVKTCLARKDTALGSSLKMDKTIGFSGVLSSKQASNPDFYNWNRIKVKYCDGSSFTGDVEAVDPSTKLYYRGRRVFRAVIEDLLAIGMSSAQNAILSGCSAGGLASILNCDNFRSLVPTSTKVKCLADAGYFIDGTDINGKKTIETFFGDVARLHGSTKTLPSSCTSRMQPELCFFPQNVVPTMQTPIFIINAAYDFWQLKNILAPSSADKSKQWANCKVNLTKCSSSQLEVVQGYRQQFLNALSAGVSKNAANGWFIHSCYAHCQIGTQLSWLSDKSVRVDQTTIPKAVGDWYFERSPKRLTDTPYPSNPTCVSVSDD
ncbi:hypothetical protein ACFE04_021402 [Oxalis oulophora]